MSTGRRNEIHRKNSPRREAGAGPVIRGAWADEWALLTTPEGSALLAEVAGVRAPLPADLDRWRRRAGAPAVAAALRLAEARRKGARKFTRAAEMWLDPVGIEQATAEAVARHKSSRFAGAGRPAVDLCCGIGGDAVALASASPAGVVAIDADPGMARRASWNARAYGVEGRVLAMVARAESRAWPAGSLAHIDPDRRARAGSPRARAVADYAPGLPFLRELMAEAPGGAIKVSPASDFRADFAGEGVEIELISLRGECKEATAWFGELAGAGVRRRATVLPAGASWTDRDGPADAYAAAAPLGAWVFEPDPSLARSGLLDGFARAHGLARVDPAATYLTGPAPVSSPFLDAFEVIESLPFDRKAVKRALRALGVGPLEVKLQGVEASPERLRAELGGGGGESLSLLLAGGRPARAIVARRILISG